MFKLKESVKKKWLNALRNGNYQQCIEQLCTYNEKGYSFCCLGVLCEQAPNSIRNYEDHYAFPPHEILKWAFKDYNRVGDLKNILNKLIDMNDDKLYSFTKIANWIEKNL